MRERLKDGSELVKLIDLGTVIRAAPHPDSVYGTPGFFAPEAVHSPSHETDLYTICRTLAYLVSLMDLETPPFGMPPADRYPVFRSHPLLYRLLCRGTHADPARRFHSAEELGEQLAGVLRLIAGSVPGIPAPSRMFMPGVTATKRLAPRGEAALDERDPAIDLLRQGDMALRLGNYPAARRLFSEAVQRNPRSSDAHGRLVEVAIELGDLAAAEAALDQARRAGLAGWKLAWYAGRLAEGAGDHPRAERHYQAVVDELPGELPPQHALARLRAQAGDDPAAVALYAGVLRADPGNSEAILGMTNALLRLERWDEVAQVLSGVSEAAARYVDAQLLLCDLFLNRITPLSAPNVAHAAQAVNALAGRTEDPRYYLARGDVYRAALQLARAGRLPTDMALPGLPRADAQTLAKAAEESYVQYLRAAQNPPDREAIVRRRFAVAPWRLF
jgi:serine/threonine-protein kinase PknG